jgi:hypothetical protein
MYSLIKKTILNKTPNRSKTNLKDWERYIVYICDKQLNLSYSLFDKDEQWDKLKREKDIKKFEKWLNLAARDERREARELKKGIIFPEV